MLMMALQLSQPLGLAPSCWTEPMFYSTGACFAFGKEGNVLFNDTLNTFYLRLYDVRLMRKDH